MFEVREHDGLGRSGVLTVNGLSVQTPNIAVVVNPNESMISPEEMARDFGVDLIITNAYIIRSSLKGKEIEAKGLHAFLNFKGIIYTDSGTYQMFSKGGVEITNEETLDYQKRIGSDIHTPLDLFTTPDDDRKTAVSKLTETIKRIKSVTSPNFSAPIQGGVFMDLRKKACLALRDVNPTVYPIGGIVPLMIGYDFKKLIEVILECKRSLPFNVPVHAFGAGHPLIFALLAYCGVDLFDSASYALYAREGKYITETGTKRVDELTSLPCDCPVCSKHKPSDLKNESLLVRHNLHSLMREVRLVRQAIRDGRLFELVYSRAVSHPRVYEAFKRLLEFKDLTVMNDPVRKPNAVFCSGELSLERPELVYALSRLSVLGLKKPVIPLQLVYPFGQSMGWSLSYAKRKYSEHESLRVLADYQFGVGAGKSLINGKEKITHSTSGRILRVMDGEDLLFVVRASDGYFSLHKSGVLRIKKFVKKVYTSDEFAKFYREGSSVFSKHVLKSDSLKPGEEVLVISGKDAVAVGEALISSHEMKDFKTGTAVKVREGILNG